jgi:hypothetical protein
MVVVGLRERSGKKRVAGTWEESESRCSRRIER